MEYKRQSDAERRKILEHLAASDQELGIWLMSCPDRPALRSKVVTKSVTKHCPIMPIYDQILVTFLH